MRSRSSRVPRTGKGDGVAASVLFSTTEPRGRNPDSRNIRAPLAMVGGVPMRTIRAGIVAEAGEATVMGAPKRARGASCSGYRSFGLRGFGGGDQTLRFRAESTRYGSGKSMSQSHLDLPVVWRVVDAANRIK